MSVIRELKNRLGISESILNAFVRTAPYRYKVYKIPKRNGKGYRVIAQPSRQLKAIQRVVQDMYLKELPIHDAATAYIQGAGIKGNVEPHKDNQYLLKMDFQNFFPSICDQDLVRHISAYSSNRYSPEDLEALSRLLFWRPERDKGLVLSIGAPTSPLISNTLMYDFDRQVADSMKKLKVSYTRYADDLSFSTNCKDVLFGVPDLIEQILSQINYPSLSINKDKTVFLSKALNRHITGLVITNDGKISIGRKSKRFIRHLVHKTCLNQISVEEYQYLRGYLSYCNSVEPTFIQSLKTKYGESTVSKIMADA